MNAALPLLLLCCLTLNQPVHAQSADEEAELARIEQAIARITAELDSTRLKRSKLGQELEKSEQEIARLRKRINGLNQDIQRGEQELASLQSRARQLESTRQQQQQLVREFLLSAYRQGSSSGARVLLSQQDPTRNSRMLRYYQHFNAARASRIEAFRETLDSISEVSTDISLKNEELRDSRKNLQVEYESLQQRQQQRTSLLAELDQSLSSGQAELQQLQRQQAEIQLLLEEIRQSIASLQLGDDDTPFRDMKGRLPWPLEGRLLNSFGSRHALGDLTWEGITISAEAGAEVRAVHHGRVEFSGWLGNSGLLLIINHGDGFMSLYAHNQDLYKAVGEWVSSGEVIAAAGNTGGQRNTGLYMEIRRNGKAEDPVNWLGPR